MHPRQPARRIRATLTALAAGLLVNLSICLPAHTKDDGKHVDPVVRAALETFPGARIERVTSRDGLEAGLAGEDGGYANPIDDDIDGEDEDQ